MKRFLQIISLTIVCGGFVLAQKPDTSSIQQNKTSANNDGSITEQVPKTFSDLPTYEQRVEITKKRFAADESLKTPEAREEALKEWQLVAPKKDYEELKSQTQVEILKIKYMSDGLKISGYIFKPRVTDGKKYPVVIFNHGGNRNPIILLDHLDCYRLAKQGFVVLASRQRRQRRQR